MVLLRVWSVSLLAFSQSLLVNPEPIIMSKSLDILGLEKSEVAMVGDLYDRHYVRY